MPCLHSKFFPGTPAIWGLCWCKVSVCHHVGREPPTFSFTSSISGNVQGIRAETGTGGPGGHVDFAGATWTGSVCEDCAGWRQALWEAWNCFRLILVSVIRSKPESQSSRSFYFLGFEWYKLLESTKTQTDGLADKGTETEESLF